MPGRKVSPNEDEPLYRQAFSGISPLPVTSELFTEDRLKEIDVDFVYMLIEDGDAVAFVARVAKAFAIVARHNGVIVSNVGGLFQLAVGDLINRASNDVVLTDSATERDQLAREIAQSLGRYVRLVHGRARSHVGYLGTESRRNWGFAPSGLSKILGSLLAAAPGTAVDLG
jgi:hypothetical protein